MENIKISREKSVNEVIFEREFAHDDRGNHGTASEQEVSIIPQVVNAALYNSRHFHPGGAHQPS